MNVRRFLRAAMVTVALGGTAAVAQDCIVAPARYSVLQVLFDVASTRSVGLVAYQGNAKTDRPVLHAWNGQEWVAVSMEAFRDGTFASVRPARIALLGGEDLLPPALAAAAQAVAPVVVNWTNLENAAIINAAGRWLGFTTREWTWLARRYNMTLSDANEERRRDSWYYHPHPHLRRTLFGPPPAERSAMPAAEHRDDISGAPPPAAPPPSPVAAPPPNSPPPAAAPAPSFAPNAMWEKPEPPPWRDAGIK